MQSIPTRCCGRLHRRASGSAARAPAAAPGPRRCASRRTSSGDAVAAAAPAAARAPGQTPRRNTVALASAGPAPEDQQQQQQQQQQTTGPQPAAGASIEPYIIRETVSIVTAAWDPREHEASEYAGFEQQLMRAGAKRIEFSYKQVLRGPDLVQLTVTCGGAGRQAAADAVAAAVLQLTAATEVRTAEEMVATLPQKRVQLATKWGTVGFDVSLKGSEPFKATPCWADCERLAAQAAADAELMGPAPDDLAPGGGSGGGGGSSGEAPPSAEDVASRALFELHQRLEDGTIALGGSPYLF